MRYAKVFLLILVFFFSMMFFIQNNAALSQTLTLTFSLYTGTWQSTPLPYYFILLLCFVAGGLFTLAFFLSDKLHAAKVLRDCKAKMANLEKEVASLRNLPLRDKAYAAANVTPAAPENQE